MKSIKHASWTSIGALLLTFWLGTAQSVWAGDESLVVIVNSANPVENISLGDLKKLFLSDKTRWDTGKSVATVMLASGAPERIAFLKIVCHVSDSDFAKYFVQAAFSGKEVSPPKEVSSAAALKSSVGSTPGAIGFVKASELSAADSTVKAVKIDGVAASDAGYKIKM
jgi:ABC-type phosphate transport system substrate-binding protein